MKEKTVAIVLAAGKGSRMNSKIHKQYLLLQNKPVLYYSLAVFQNSFIDEIILVTGIGEEEYCRSEIVEKYHLTKVSKIITGGAERYHSVKNGLDAAKGCSYVFIHDGARPFVDLEMLDRLYRAVRQEKACVAGMPSKDTVKIADKNGFAADTPRRDLVWTIQTPQVFSYSLIKDAYDRLFQEEDRLKKQEIRVTDDAMLVELFESIPVDLVEGSYQNIKITTPEDLKIAEAFLE